MRRASEEYAGEVMVAEIIDRREREPLPSNPPPGPKWQAKQGMARLPLNGGEYAVLACLIDRASSGKRACYPSQEFISGWTFRPLRTVRRAIKALSDKGIIRILYRGTTSSAYLISWPPLFAAYRQMKALEKCNTERHAEQKVADDAPKSGRESIPKVAAKPMNLEPMTLSAPSSDGAYVVVLREEEKGIQERGEVESASTNSQPPAEPNVYTFININAEKTEAAATAVEADLSRHSLYGALLGWPELEAHLSDAATAEISEKGSGARLVLARFAERKAS